MQLSKVNEIYVKHDAERFCQGDILRDITIVEWAEEKDGEVITRERNLSYSVILTQDCDLLWDYKNRNELSSSTQDKYLQAILLCPAYTAESVKQGIHLKDLGLNMLSMNRDLWKPITQNTNYRYQYLIEENSYQIPELVLDFKHYFTIPRDVLYRPEFKGCYLASLAELFREHLSSRFAHYLCRIGLPDIPSHL